MTSYTRGLVAERAAQKKLEREDYLCVRSAGSKGPFDLIAIGRSEVICIQVKRRKRASIREQEALIALLQRMPPNSRIEVWTMTDGKTWEREDIGLGLRLPRPVGTRRFNAVGESDVQPAER